MHRSSTVLRIDIALVSESIRCAVDRALPAATLAVTSEVGTECELRIVGACDIGAHERSRDLAPPTLVVIDDAPRSLEAAMTTTAAGYVDARDLHLIAPLAASVAQGVVCMSPRIVERLRAFIGATPAEPVRGIELAREDLTKREREVLELFSVGLSYGETAAELGISINTVRQHVRNIYEKLDVGSESAAVIAASARNSRR